MKRISSPVDSDLEIAATSDRVLGMGGPALLFENVKGSSMPVAVNLLGTMERVVWVLSSQVDPQRDLFTLDNTPFDTLDFASENIGLGGRLAIDATTKISPEKNLDWSKPSTRPKKLEDKVDERWAELGLSELENKQPSPELFGYVIYELMRQKQVNNS